jgi:hypothetical protein
MWSQPSKRLTLATQRLNVSNRFRSISSTSSKSDQTEPERMGVGAQASLDTHLHKLERPSKPPPKLVVPKKKINDSSDDVTSLIPETLKEMEEDEEFQVRMVAKINEPNCCTERTPFAATDADDADNVTS